MASKYRFRSLMSQVLKKEVEKMGSQRGSSASSDCWPEKAASVLSSKVDMEGARGRNKH